MPTKTKHVDMCNGPIFVNIIKYTIPIILTGLLQLLFNAADLMVVGWFCGSNSVGAVGATSSLISLLVNMFIGVASGISVVTANAIGAKRRNETIRIVHTVVPLGVIVGAFLMVVGFFVSAPLLQIMDTPSELLPLGTVYTKIYFCGMIPNLAFNFCAAILRAAGDTKTPMKYLSIAGVVNVVVNVFFVTAIKLDVAGVALATVISQLISFVLILRALMRRDDDCKFDIKRIKIDKNALGKIMHIGLPAGIQSSVFSISNVIIQSSVNSFGAVAVSGNSAAASLEGFVYVAMNAFYQTSLNFTGKNMGAENYERVLKSLKACLISVVTVGAILGVIFRLLAPNLLSFYITDNPDAVLYGVKRVSYICLFYFLCGIMEVMTGAIRGMGASVVTLFISVIGVCGVRLGWIFTIFRIEQFHTLDSLYFSYLISWAVCIIAQIIAFSIVYKRNKNRFTKNTAD